MRSVRIWGFLWIHGNRTAWNQIRLRDKSVFVCESNENLPFISDENTRYPPKIRETQPRIHWKIQTFSDCETEVQWISKHANKVASLCRKFNQLIYMWWHHWWHHTGFWTHFHVLFYFPFLILFWVHEHNYEQSCSNFWPFSCFSVILSTKNNRKSVKWTSVRISKMSLIRSWFWLQELVHIC